MKQRNVAMLAAIVGLSVSLLGSAALPARADQDDHGNAQYQQQQHPQQNNNGRWGNGANRNGSNRYYGPANQPNGWTNQNQRQWNQPR